MATRLGRRAPNLLAGSASQQLSDAVATLAAPPLAGATRAVWVVPCPACGQRAALANPRPAPLQARQIMIRKLSSGGYRLYSRKLDPRTGKRRNLGTFKSRAAAERHERAVQYFKHH
jgi:hypothetical protein